MSYMLYEFVDDFFGDKEWIFELKWISLYFVKLVDCYYEINCVIYRMEEWIEFVVEVMEFLLCWEWMMLKDQFYVML